MYIGDVLIEDVMVSLIDRLHCNLQQTQDIIDGSIVKLLRTSCDDLHQLPALHTHMV